MGPAAVLPVAEAAALLPLGDTDARDWLTSRGLILPLRHQGRARRHPRRPVRGGVMPRTGRPPTPPDRARGRSVKVYLTAAELAELDRRIADEAAATGTAPDSRSDWLLRAAGIRPEVPDAR